MQCMPVVWWWTMVASAIWKVVMEHYHFLAGMHIQVVSESMPQKREPGGPQGCWQRRCWRASCGHLYCGVEGTTGQMSGRVQGGWWMGWWGIVDEYPPKFAGLSPDLSSCSPDNVATGASRTNSDGGGMAWGRWWTKAGFARALWGAAGQVFKVHMMRMMSRFNRKRMRMRIIYTYIYIYMWHMMILIVYVLLYYICMWWWWW